MKISEVSISEIKMYGKNQKKHPDEQINNIAISIDKYGFVQPLVLDSNNEIIIGHGRYLAAKKLGIEKVPSVYADNLSEEQIRELRIIDNKLNESEWDFEQLKADLDELDFSDFDIDFDIDEEKATDNSGTGNLLDSENYNDFTAGSLSEKWIVPPFSVLNVNSPQWTQRKKSWMMYIHSKKGRSDSLISEGYGTSVFDPVLMEIMIAWFCPLNGKIIDCFSGGSVRGIVSSFTGHDYFGMDLREEQITANEREYEEIKEMCDFYGNPLSRPKWVCGDSITIDEKANDEYDFMLTCPPYADLEVYSDNPRDLSNMNYGDFKKAYFEIINKTTSKLKENAYAVCVVGEVRDKKGYYYNFVSDTIKAFEEAGLKYYNEIILTQPIGTAALRANNIFGRYRKVAKSHQNVLVFLKGDEKKIDLQPYDYKFDCNDQQEALNE